MMVHVLQRLKPSGILEEYPNLAAYVGPRRSAAGLQAGFQRTIGVQATGRLIEFRPGLEVAIRVSFNYGS